MSSSMVPEGRLPWIDLETTGLDAEEHVVLELGIVITEADLTVVAERSWVVSQPKEALERMPDIVHEMHVRSGLLDEVRRSRLSTLEVADLALEFMNDHLVPGTAPLCGNSIGALDRPFLARHMPAVLKWLHYRMVDVSTVKELVRRWAPQWNYGAKKLAHRALDDCHESILEARWYREALFAGPQVLS